MNENTARRPALGLWVLIFGLWALLVLAFAGQLVFTASLPWTDAIIISVRDWVPWLLLGPAVAWLAYRFPLERPHLAMSIPVHVVACMLTLLAGELLLRTVAPRPTGPGPAGPPHIERLPRRERPPVDPSRPPVAPQPYPREAPRPPPTPHAFVVGAFSRRAQFHLPVYWIVVSIVHALQYYRRSQERERVAAELEARLAESKLNALRMQLHPHFLFNTLNAVATLVHKDPKAADEMIGNLSELLRATLDLSDQQEIPLREELELANRYLQIQQVRLGDRLEVRREIDPAALDGLVPTMILQPLVENALRHGIEPKPGPGWVRLTATKADQILRLTVSDSGAGIKSAPAQEGIGLANTRARLQGLYHGQARLTLVDSGMDHGCAVRIEIPFRQGATQLDGTSARSGTARTA